MNQARIYFTKRIESGTLKGMILHDSITFPDDEQHLRVYAKRYAIGSTRKAWAYGPAYTVVDASFQNYQRGR